MSGPDVLGGGPGDQGPDRLGSGRIGPGRIGPGRRRRGWTVAGTVLVAAAASVLAVRSTSEPPARPPVAAPTPTVAAPTGPQPIILGTAVGSQWAYALLASCTDPDQLTDCTTRLLRRSLGGGGWTPVEWRTRLLSGSYSLLFVTPDDQVTVVDEPTAGQVYASTDGGRTAKVRRLRPGPPVAAIPPGGILDLGLCEMCSARLTVLDPATGQLRRLAVQPSFGRTAGIRSMASSGDVVWVVAESGESGKDLVTAVSTDRGRSWRTLPVPGTAAPAMVVRVFSDGRGAYVLIGRDSRPEVLNEFTELWRIGDPTAAGAAWRRVTPARRPPSAVTLVPGERGLLISTEDGEAWRLLSDGTLLQLPQVDYGGVSIEPGLVVSGPSRVFVGLPLVQSDLPRPTLVVSFDEGESWRAEEIGG